MEEPNGRHRRLRIQSMSLSLCLSDRPVRMAKNDAHWIRFRGARCEFRTLFFWFLLFFPSFLISTRSDDWQHNSRENDRPGFIKKRSTRPTSAPVTSQLTADKSIRLCFLAPFAPTKQIFPPSFPTGKRAAAMRKRKKKGPERARPTYLL